MLKSRPVCGMINNKSSAAAEMGNCLATIDMGGKSGVVPLFGAGAAGPHLTQGIWAPI